MNKNSQVKTRRKVLQELLPARTPAREPVGVLSSLASDLYRIHSASGSALFRDWLANLVAPFSPGGSVDLLDRMPTLYQAQSERTVKALAETAQTMLGVQQRLFDWQLDSVKRILCSER